MLIRMWAVPGVKEIRSRRMGCDAQPDKVVVAIVTIDGREVFGGITPYSTVVTWSRPVA